MRLKQFHLNLFMTVTICLELRRSQGQPDF
jgi:hypothetical protein